MANSCKSSRQEELEKQTGTGWSELHPLEYYDLVRCTVIDPMHNLFLSTVKRITDRGMEEGILPPRVLTSLQKIADSNLVWPEFKALCYKIKSGFPSMKAAEWRSWRVLYAPYVLNGVVPSHYLDNFMMFVDACRLLAKPSVSFADLDTAHNYLLSSCCGCERIYGKDFITPNVHMHIRLKEIFRDFGLAYAFWLFGFERHDGLLGSIDTNRKGSFEVTFAKAFVEQCRTIDYLLSIGGQLEDDGQLLFLQRFASNSQRFTTVMTSLDSDEARSEQFVQDRSMLSSAKGCEPLPSSALPSSFKNTELPAAQY